MSDATLRAALKARLLALGVGIGQVHDYERWVVEPSKFLALFQDLATRKVFGWEITRPGFEVRKVAMNKWKMIHHYLLRGYYGLADAAGTEKAFGLLIDAIALDLMRTKIVGTQNEMLPKAAIEPRMFGSVLCHVAEIRVDLEEIVSPAEEEDAAEILRIGLNYYLKPGDDVVDATDLVELRE